MAPLSFGTITSLRADDDPYNHESPTLTTSNPADGGAPQRPPRLEHAATRRPVSFEGYGGADREVAVKPSEMYEDTGPAGPASTTGAIQKLDSHTSQHTVVNDEYDDWVDDRVGVGAVACPGYVEYTPAKSRRGSGNSITSKTSIVNEEGYDTLCSLDNHATYLGPTPIPTSTSTYAVAKHTDAAIAAAAAPIDGQMRIVATGRWRDEPARFAALQHALGRPIELLQQDDEVQRLRHHFTPFVCANTAVAMPQRAICIATRVDRCASVSNFASGRAGGAVCSRHRRDPVARQAGSHALRRGRSWLHAVHGARSDGRRRPPRRR